MAQIEMRRNAREYAQIFTTARQTISKYGSHKDAIRGFFQRYTDDSDDILWGNLKYMAALQAISDKRSHTLHIDLDEFETTCKDSEVIGSLILNTQRYLQFFYEVSTELLPTRSANYIESDAFGERAFDEWRESVADGLSLPPQLKQSFQITFSPCKGMRPTPLREVRSSCVGSLVKMDCIVSRVNSVKPKIEVASYHCETCGQDIWQVVETETFLPITSCPTATCKTNQQMGSVSLQLRLSKMTKFQEIKVQEPASDVPAGHVPMSMTVVLAGDLTRSCLPGDSIAITGIYMPFEYTGFQALKKGSTPDLYLMAHHVDKHKRGYSEAAGNEQNVIARVLSSANTGNIYELLAKSIAPEIYGHLDVKKAMLLQLVGGCTRSMHDGMKIRGDMHVLLMGDPGVAKSQLLKYISGLAPRAVYTTGKGSSGVGLTASVLRDKFTKEVSLEGGALVMADMGICCIDEFDKMEESDRTAIHEVMEQQTVSIAKAGITTTLNARASVLAAANPAYGRYNPTKSVLQNMNLPAALLSRFDLQFLLLDRADPERDTALAKHVGHVHRFSDIPALDFEPLSMDFIRTYVRHARQHSPNIDPDLIPEIVNQYTNLRQAERQESHSNRGNHEENNKSYTTPRTLLAMLRMSQALARLRFSETVERGDFMEAVRLMVESKQSVEDSARENKNQGGPRDLVSQVWECLLGYLKRVGEQEWVSVLELEKHAQARGFSLEAVKDTLNQYADLNVILMNPEKTRVCVGV